MSAKTPLKTKFNRFLLKNRDKGIPNLMLWIAVGNAVVYALGMLNPSNPFFYNLLCFDTRAILHGEVWRLFSFVFVYLYGRSILLGGIGLLCYWMFGRVLEQYWGRLRFNLYYLTGILLMDILAVGTGALLPLLGVSTIEMSADISYLNLSIFLAVAVIQPDAMVRIWFVIPVKMKWLVWVYFGFTAFEIVKGVIYMIRHLPAMLDLNWLMSVVALGNFFLFFGKQVSVLLPERMRYRTVRPKTKRRQTAQKANPDWAAGYRSGSGEAPYRFRCTVCGRTDRDYPNLEFRYCSRCEGYRCYCIEHINNHPHI